EDITATDGMTVENAIAKIWKAQVYSRMSDYWGPIIYSQFGNGQTSVAYDSQPDVYTDFFNILDEADAVLAAAAGSTATFGPHDLIIEGDVDQWRRFANSLRLRLAMRISYVDADRARQIAEDAYAAGVIESNADNAEVDVSENSSNGYARITDWGEFRM